MSQSQVRPTKRQIPTFASWQEEAEFWDTHDVTDYFDDFEYDPAWFRVEGPLSEIVPLHIDVETKEEVRALAEEQGFPPVVLPQIWILERRDAERARRAEALAASASDGTAATVAPTGRGSTA